MQFSSLVLFANRGIFELQLILVLEQALLSGFVDQVGEDQYQVNLNYPEPRTD